MTTYLQISVSGHRSQTEALLPSLLELGCLGFEETDTHLIGYVLLPPDPAAADRLRDAFRAILRTVSSNAEIAFAEIGERNWNEEWERSIRPIEVGRRIAVAPSWRAYDGDRSRIVLTIDPKMSFGTGYHESTRLMLLLLERYLREGMRVLDVGTGTGILAIAAVKLGARSADGTDTDEWAIENAAENVRRNGLANRVAIHRGTIPPGPPAAWDLVCANLTLRDIAGLLDTFRSILPGGGLLLLSGLLAGDESAVRVGLERAGFGVAETVREGEWIGICAR